MSADEASGDRAPLNRPEDNTAEAEGTVAWRELLAEATVRLGQAGIEEPEVSARRIVEECSGADGAELALVLGDPVTKRGIAAFDRRLARRLAGEPIQYVVGRWGFRSLDLFVDKRVLIPRPETEIVAGVAIDEVQRLAANGSVTVADLGCGSGAIGLSIADESSDVDVWLTDVSEDAVVVARSNLAGLGRKATRTRIAVGSWFDALPVDLMGSVGVIASNPPYIASSENLSPAVTEWEPALALVPGPTGTEALDLIVDTAPHWLVDDGALVLEMSPWQTDNVAERAGRYFVDVDVFDDLNGVARGIVARFLRR